MSDLPELRSVPVPRVEDKEIPFGIKFNRVINGIQMFLFIVAGSLLAVMVIRNFSQVAAEHNVESSPQTALFAGLIAFSFFLIPALLLAVLNSGLKKMSSAARLWQVIVSCLLMLEFPFGTILYGMGLYYLLGDEETRAAFEEQA